MEIRRPDGKCHMLFGSVYLMRGGGSHRGIEGNIGGAVLCETSGNVAAAFAIGTGERPAAAMLTGYAIEGILQTPGGKCGSHLDLVAAFPPAGAE